MTFRVPGTQKFWRHIVLLGCLTGLLLLVFAGNKNLAYLWSLCRESERLACQLEELKTTNQKLIQQIHDLQKDSKAIEGIAREELGLVQPGETVYRLLPSLARRSQER